jgi:hypothetical protein
MATNPNITHFPMPPQALPEQGRPLARKLATVLMDVHRVPKNGRNDFHGYDYVYESDLVDHIRTKLAEQGVALFPSVREHTVDELQDARNRTVYLTTVTLDVSLIDGESGDMMTTTWVGQGLDNGDKGYYKAYTGAIKYFLLKTFLISTGDDPENDDAPRPVNGRKQAPAPTPKAAPKAAPAPKAVAAPEEKAENEKNKWSERSKEFRALLEESAEPEVCDSFQNLYVERMGAENLEEIDAQKISAMCRKLRGMNAETRKNYIEGVIENIEE